VLGARAGLVRRGAVFPGALGRGGTVRQSREVPGRGGPQRCLVAARQAQAFSFLGRMSDG